MPRLTFDFKYDYGDETWTAQCQEFPGLAGVHTDPYEALLDVAYVGFNLAERPEDAEFEHRRTYTQLNIDFFPYVPPKETDVEMEERVLSPEQQERLRRLNFDGV